MVYELKVYTPHDGKGEAMRQRFLTVVVPIFKRLGIEVVNVFAVTGSEELSYIVRFTDEDARQRAWVAFKDDPEWATAKAKSEADGPLLRSQTTTMMTKLA